MSPKPFHILVLLFMVFAAATADAQFSVLYNFGSNAGDPFGPHSSGVIVQGRDGNLYSTTAAGGAGDNGAVFKITPAGVVTTLYSFTSGNDGCCPYGGLTLGTDGNFYGTTAFAGTYGYGTIFKITPGGTLTTLYSFGYGDGAYPSSPPVQGRDGNWYGTVNAGGANGEGTVYKMTPAGVLTTLYNFDYTHGGQPFDPLVLATDGNFYGTTNVGGSGGYGTIFKITPAGKLTVLYSFDGTHGGYPNGALIQGSDRNFYGTAGNYGSNGGGVVFKMTPSGVVTVLRNLNPGTDGNYPLVGLVQASDGNFYGSNDEGGSNSDGTLFEITPKGSYSVLYNFDGTHGSEPQATPLQHTNGIVYGDAYTGGTGNVYPCTAPYCGVLYSWNNSLPAFAGLLPPLSSGKVGKVIQFLGQGFVKGKTTVTFSGNVAATVNVVSGTYLTAAVPAGALTGTVAVTTSGVTLNTLKTFRVIPQITSFRPSSGKVGTVVTITGVSLTQTTKVTFGGVAATNFTVNSDTQVTAYVPTGAKTGHIAITTPGGVATSSGVFTVTQ